MGRVRGLGMQGRRVLHRARSAPAVCAATALSLLLLGPARPAYGQQVDSAARGAARALGYEGIQAFQAGDLPLAVDRLERAYQVLRVPSLALWSARALEKSGNWVEASERYLEATRLPIEDGSDRAVQEQAQAEARAAEAELRPKIPLVVIEVRGAEPSQVEVSCNGTSVNRALLGSGLPTNPGEVVVQGALGERRVEARTSALEGRRSTVVLDFAPAADDASPADEAPGAAAVSMTAASPPPAAPRDAGAPRGRTQRWLGWGFLGAGAGLVVMGGVTGGLALAEQGSLDDAGCNSGGGCPPGTDISTINTMRILSSVGFIAGGVLAVSGATLLLTAPKSKNVAVRARVGVAALELEGTF